MRVSETFELQRTQPTLEFLDVDVDTDVRLFIDPRSLRLIDSDWGEECIHLIQDFFDTVLRHISQGRDEKAQSLLGVLREPNETRLGLSRGKPQGRALGDELSVDVWESLSESQAVASGLLEDLEDTVLLVPGIGPDIVSDMATGIIRGPLIEFTQDACDYYGMKMQEDVASGATWNPVTHDWSPRYTRLPMVGDSRLLLVPKSIVRIRQNYDPGEYYRYFLLEELRSQELASGGPLVQLLKNGTPRVTKKSLMAKYGTGKEVIVRETLKNPQVLDRYRAFKSARTSAPLTHDEISERTGTPQPDWDELLSDVLNTPRGKEAAQKYHLAVEALLSALFYPALIDPRREFPIHQGRKRIDIKYTNAGVTGFFSWLIHVHKTPASFVVVECKNYRRPIGNPELDQLAGRFAPQRGKFGLLVYRGYVDKADQWERCRDTARDDRGYIVPVDDQDLVALVNERKTSTAFTQFDYLSSLFEQLL